jgi:Serpin (serine protease inhibitor)
MTSGHLQSLRHFIAGSIIVGAVTTTPSTTGDARFAALTATTNPSLAAGSLSTTLDVLQAFGTAAGRPNVNAWKRGVDPSPAGRSRTTVFVNLRTIVSPKVRARVGKLGGTIVRSKRPDLAANAALSRNGSPIRIPQADFAVLGELTFTALWARPIPMDRGPQRLFHGTHASVRSPFLHGREEAVVEAEAGFRRLVIPISEGNAEFVWSGTNLSADVPVLLGRPVRRTATRIYDVVIPRRHRRGVFSLRRPLERAGLRELFSGARGGNVVSDIVQATDLHFNEYGIHLRAESVAFTTLGVLHDPVQQIVIDRPFWLRISDARNRSIYVARVDDL